MSALFQWANDDLTLSEDEPVIVRTPSYLQNLTQVFLSEPTMYVLHVHIQYNIIACLHTVSTIQEELYG